MILEFEAFWCRTTCAYQAVGERIQTYLSTSSILLNEKSGRRVNFGHGQNRRVAVSHLGLVIVLFFYGNMLLSRLNRNLLIRG